MGEGHSTLSITRGSDPIGLFLLVVWCIHGVQLRAGCSLIDGRTDDAQHALICGDVAATALVVFGAPPLAYKVARSPGEARRRAQLL